MTTLKRLFASFAFASTVASAQVPQPPGAPPRIDVATLLHLDATRAQAVEAILETARLKHMELREQLGPPTDDSTRAAFMAGMQAIRDDTDQKLATVLSPDEIATLKAAMPRPRGRRQPQGDQNAVQ